MQEIPLTCPRPVYRPGQIRAYDTRDDRTELLTLLNYLSPARRVAWMDWVCAQAYLGAGDKVKPVLTRATRRLADDARHCDRASERLNVDFVGILIHLSIDYRFNLDRAVAELERRVKATGKR